MIEVRNLEGGMIARGKKFDGGEDDLSYVVWSWQAPAGVTVDLPTPVKSTRRSAFPRSGQASLDRGILPFGFTDAGTSNACFEGLRLIGIDKSGEPWHHCS